MHANQAKSHILECCLLLAIRRCVYQMLEIFIRSLLDVVSLVLGRWRETYRMVGSAHVRQGPIYELADHRSEHDILCTIDKSLSAKIRGYSSLQELGASSS